MADPITVGSLVAAMLAAGATETGKTGVGPPVRDAYDALKAAAARVLGPAVGWLERKPDSDDLLAPLDLWMLDAARANLAAAQAAR